jgi:hypothetical protein
MTECGMPQYHTCNFVVNVEQCVICQSGQTELIFRDLNTDETQSNVCVIAVLLSCMNLETVICIISSR